MRTWLILSGRHMLNLLIMQLAEATGQPPDGDGEKAISTVAILVSVAVVLCALPVCVIAVLAVFGPAIGNFLMNTNIIDYY